MWALMTVAMMAPTAVPVLAALTDILHRGPRTRWWLFLAGYLTAWLGFAVPVASTQVAAHRVVDDLFHGSGARFAWGAVLLLAGAYQFSAMKQRCLTECTTPMTFFLRHWRDGRWGAVRMGLRHGVACIGCCWALMLLAFVAGLDSVWLMAACAALMALEKLPSLAQQLAPALGAALIAAGVVLLLFSSGGTHHSVGPNIFP